MREVIVFNKDDICRLLSGAEINVKDSKGQIIRTYMSEERYNRDYSFNQNGYPENNKED